MQPYSDDRHAGFVAMVAGTIVLVTLIYFASSCTVTSKKAETLIIRDALEKNIDVSSLRCVLNPSVAGCDTISLVRELKVDPRFAPRDMPSVGHPQPEIQP